MRFLLSALCVMSFAVAFVSCKTQTATTSSSQDKYSEDLSVWRPKAETATQEQTQSSGEKKATAYVEPKHDVTKQVNTVLDSIDRIYISRKVINGFTIQVYSGKREEALNAKKTLASSLPELDAEIQFTEPIFRVKVGKYYTRMEAQQDYTDVKRFFPAAIIIPEKIPME